MQLTPRPPLQRDGAKKQAAKPGKASGRSASLPAKQTGRLNGKKQNISYPVTGRSHNVAGRNCAQPVHQNLDQMSLNHDVYHAEMRKRLVKFGTGVETHAVKEEVYHAPREMEKDFLSRDWKVEEPKKVTSEVLPKDSKKTEQQRKIAARQKAAAEERQRQRQREGADRIDVGGLFDVGVKMPKPPNSEQTSSTRRPPAAPGKAIPPQRGLVTTGADSQRMLVSLQSSQAKSTVGESARVAESFLAQARSDRSGKKDESSPRGARPAARKRTGAREEPAPRHRPAVDTRRKSRSLAPRSTAMAEATKATESFLAQARDMKPKATRADQPKAARATATKTIAKTNGASKATAPVKSKARNPPKPSSSAGLSGFANRFSQDLESEPTENAPPEPGPHHHKTSAERSAANTETQPQLAHRRELHDIAESSEEEEDDEEEEPPPAPPARNRPAPSASPAVSPTKANNVHDLDHLDDLLDSLSRGDSFDPTQILSQLNKMSVEAGASSLPASHQPRKNATAATGRR